VRDHIADIQQSLNFEIDIMTYMLEELRRFTQIHDSISELASGINDLVKGELSPHLLPVEEASKLLNATRRKLSLKSLRLCYQSVREIYQNSNFAFHRESNDLYVILRLPYSKMATIENYHKMTFPMQVIGQRYITELKNFPSNVLSDTRIGIVGEINQAPTNNMISLDQTKRFGTKHFRNQVYLK